MIEDDTPRKCGVGRRDLLDAFDERPFISVSLNCLKNITFSTDGQLPGPPSFLL